MCTTASASPLTCTDKLTNDNPVTHTTHRPTLPPPLPPPPPLSLSQAPDRGCFAQESQVVVQGRSMPLSRAQNLKRIHTRIMCVCVLCVCVCVCVTVLTSQDCWQVEVGDKVLAASSSGDAVESHVIFVHDHLQASQTLRISYGVCVCLRASE
jgi:hypothetical protein